MRQFVEKCLATVSRRLPAWQLLQDPFLQFDDYGYDLRPTDYQRGFDEIGPHLRQPQYGIHHSYLINGYSKYLGYEHDMDLGCHTVEYEESEIDLFTCHDDEHLGDVDITIKGRRKEDNSIFLRLRIADKEGQALSLILFKYCISHTSFLFLLNYEVNFKTKFRKQIYSSMQAR